MCCEATLFYLDWAPAFAGVTVNIDTSGIFEQPVDPIATGKGPKRLPNSIGPVESRP
jgi:hypothetical protein